MENKERKILVVASQYPDKDLSYGGIFYHTRNLYYQERGIKVTVIKFGISKNYKLDGIEVIREAEYKKRKKEWKIIVCHAPDRNIYKFLRTNENNFKYIMFFVHGNEVLKKNNYLKSEYKYIQKDNAYQKIVQSIRDEIKVSVWRWFYEKVHKKSQWIFVSQWMYEEFLKNIKMKESILGGRSHIIYNCVARPFEKSSYSFAGNKQIDFITIRGNFDSMKYGVDIVSEIAKRNPQYNFLIVGRGKYFQYYEKSSNLHVMEGVLQHEKVVELLLNSKCGLMPTRHDAQGVMMCEMATFGIPLITSNISVCHEVLEGFENVFYIDNDAKNIDLESILNSIKGNDLKNEKFMMKNTCEAEVKLLEKMFDKNYK